MIMNYRRYLLKFYYIGTKKFHGSQKQPNLLTIEECLLNVLKEKNYVKNDEESRFELASRTDRYVSARGAACSFVTQKEPILMEINTVLPKEIGIWAFAKVPIDFLSRFNAVFRHYKYIVPQPLSYLKKRENINLKIMRKACKELEGQHDFANFYKQEKEPVKTLRDMNSVKMTVRYGYLIFDFKSRAFLRQQIRRIVQKVVELGTGKIEYDDFLKLFDKSYRFSYQPADPSGLILWDIIFDDVIKFKIDPKSKERMNKYFQQQEIEFGLKKQLFNILQKSNFS